MSLPRIAIVLVCAAAMHPRPSWGQEIVTRTVAVDGLEIRVRTSDLSKRPANVPAVVFESGAAAQLETWDTVLDAVAQFAPVVTYDRSGTGRTPWDGQPPTFERIGARLERLLAELGVPPPYVLVGHSLGGALVRYYAGSHPKDVVGILYIDPSDITITHADMNTLFMSAGAKDGDYDTFRQRMEKTVPTTGAIGAEMAVMTKLLDADPAERGLPPVPPASASVILAGRIAPLPQKLVTFDAKAYGIALQEFRATRLRGWVTGRGTFAIASESGHFIHRQEPQRVIDAIRALVFSDRP